MNIFKDKRNILILAVCIAIPHAVGLASSLIVGDFSFYDSLKQPPLAPAPAVFPIVWTALYTLMGISLFLILQKRDIILPVAVFAVQLALNFTWVIVFFGAHKILAAFSVLAALIFAVSVMLFCFAKKSKAAALIQLPYLIWLFFAAYLNFSIFLLND